MSAKDAGPRLGRGLAALLGEPNPAVAGVAAAAVRAIPVEHLEPGPFQPRRNLDPASFAELVESVRTRGILQPILARSHPRHAGRYQIVAGERRWRAAQQAGLHEIPALLRDLSDSDAMAAALVENLQRQDLNSIEEAEGYRRLLDEFGLTQEKLGDVVGKSRSHIANCLRLLNLPETVRAEVQNGALTAGHARALLAHPEPGKAALVVIARGLNVRQTEELVRQSSAPDKPKRAEATQADPETRVLARDLSNHLGLKVDISFNGNSGQVRIRYRSLDQLDGLVALLNRT